MPTVFEQNHFAKANGKIFQGWELGFTVSQRLKEGVSHRYGTTSSAPFGGTFSKLGEGFFTIPAGFTTQPSLFPILRCTWRQIAAATFRIARFYRFALVRGVISAVAAGGRLPPLHSDLKDAAFCIGAWENCGTGAVEFKSEKNLDKPGAVPIGYTQNDAAFCGTQKGKMP